MSAMGMEVDMYGSQSQNSMFNKLVDAGSQVVSGWASGGFKTS